MNKVNFMKYELVIIDCITAVYLHSTLILLSSTMGSLAVVKILFT